MNLRAIFLASASCLLAAWACADEPSAATPAAVTETPAVSAPEPTPTSTTEVEKAQAPTAPSGVMAPAVTARSGKAKVYVIPVREQIAQPTLFILRRGLKEAIEQKADVVLLDMKTPGGEAGVTIEIMEALEKFPGETMTFVNTEAGSAGAIIAMVTDEIYFAPTGVMGAAELILGTGADAPEALKRKLTSYIAAKTEALSASPTPRRAEVLKAMMNADFELKIDDKVISPKGELLTLSAAKAVAVYGEPPEPLLASGIVADVDALLVKKFGADNFEVREYRVTWSERLAQYLTKFAPVLMGLGMLLLFIEFKTPGFGAPGIAGLALIAIVFFGHYVAGLSGHEPLLVFALGVVLVALEILFFPGIVVMALTGVVLMLGSLVWAMADLWPAEPIRFSGDVFAGPLQNLGLALVITVVLAALVLRFLPKTWFWDKLVLSAAIDANSQGGAKVAESSLAGTSDPLIGAEGVAVTGMFPTGEVEVNGRRYEARHDLGHITAGTPIIVKRRASFGLIVERKDA